MLNITNKAVSKWERGIPIAKDKTPNMMTPFLYIISHNNAVLYFYRLYFIFGEIANILYKQ